MSFFMGMLFEFVLLSAGRSGVFEHFILVEVRHFDVCFEGGDHVENVEIEVFHVFVFG